MGKVTVIVESETKTTSQLEKEMHDVLHFYVGTEPEVDVFVVPSDDE